MTATGFDFTPLLPAGLPAAAAKWTGLAKYSFGGGNNDPLDGLIDAVNAVLRREGRALATYGQESGPQGYRALRQFLSAKLNRDDGIAALAEVYRKEFGVPTRIANVELRADRPM
jgi:2-aminoadipate transaminase